MKTTYPCLSFDGTAKEAFDRYKSIFGGEFGAVIRFRDMEGVGGLPDDEADRIAHISLQIGNNVLIASDTLPSYTKRPFVAGNNFYVTIEPDTAEEADRVFENLSEGGDVEMPIAATEWAEKFGMCTDRFGVQWMINYAGNVQWEAPPQSADTAA